MTAESGAGSEHRRNVECPGAHIEIGCARRTFPSKLRYGATSPDTVDVEAQQMIEKIVARRDGREHSADERAFRLAIGRDRSAMLCRDVVDQHRPKLTVTSHAGKRATLVALVVASL